MQDEGREKEEGEVNLLLLLLFSLQYRKFRVVDESEKVNKD